MNDPVLRVTAPAPFSTTWETHSDGTNYYQSPEWYRYVGEGDGSSYGEDWLRFYHPDDREYLLREWRKSIASNGDHRYDVTVRIRRHDGIYRRFRVQGAPVFTPDGAVRKWVGTCTDVHDRVESLTSDRSTGARPREDVLRCLEASVPESWSGVSSSWCCPVFFPWRCCRLPF